MFRRVRGAAANYVGSVSGDATQIRKTLTSKFGSMESLSNTFDQRITDGLADLLSGATGIRTSSIPEISDVVLKAKEENRAKRQEVLDVATDRAGLDPPKGTILKYPENFFTEDDPLIRKDIRGLSIVETLGEMRGEQGFEDTSRLTIGTASVFGRGTESKHNMTNYIHFRSLQRKLPAKDREHHYDIFLYVPNTLSDAINVTYSEAEKDLTAEGVAAIFPIAGRNWFKGTDMGWDEFKTIMMSGAPGGDFIKRSVGKTINPLKFQLFQGVNMRTYTYNFEFRPMSEVDSKNIREITYAFRKSMLPGTMGGASRTYTFPNEWAIRYHGPINKWVDYPMTTVCTNATVNWAPNGFKQHVTDGSPATVTLALTFTELVTLDRDRFDKRSSAFIHNDGGPNTENASGEGPEFSREQTQIGSISDIV